MYVYGGGEGVKVQPEGSWLLKTCFQACALSLATLRSLFRFRRSAGSLTVGCLCLWRVKERLGGRGESLPHLCPCSCLLLRKAPLFFMDSAQPFGVTKSHESMYGLTGSFGAFILKRSTREELLSSTEAP